MLVPRITRWLSLFARESVPCFLLSILACGFSTEPELTPPAAFFLLIRSTQQVGRCHRIGHEASVVGFVQGSR